MAANIFVKRVVKEGEIIQIRSQEGIKSLNKGTLNTTYAPFFIQSCQNKNLKWDYDMLCFSNMNYFGFIFVNESV